VFGADERVQRGALRGRLKHLGQLGLPGVGRGKGQRIEYSYDQTVQMLIALLFSDIGIDPIVTVRLVKQHWKSLVPWVRRATDDEAKAGNSIFLTLRPRLMSGAWSRPRHPLETVTWIGAFRRFDYFQKDRDGRPIQRENISAPLDHCADEGWLCVRDLTDDLNKLRSNLDCTTTEGK
jgi:hypothetical protein